MDRYRLSAREECREPPVGRTSSADANPPAIPDLPTAKTGRYTVVALLIGLALLLLTGVAAITLRAWANIAQRNAYAPTQPDRVVYLPTPTATEAKKIE